MGSTVQLIARSSSPPQPNTTTDSQPTPPDGKEDSSSSNKTAIIAGAVGGTVGALLLIAVAVFVTRRYLRRHRQEPDPGFQVDSLSPDMAEVEPFVSTAVPTDITDTSTSAGPTKDASLPIPSLPHAMVNSTSTTSLVIANPASSGEASSSKPTRTEDSGYSADLLTPSIDVHAAPARVVHEADAEDDVLEVLPPMYREAWGERHTRNLLDGSVAVNREEERKGPGLG